MSSNLTIIGCGNMGSAIAQAILEGGLYAAKNLTFVEKNPSPRCLGFQAMGASLFDDIDQLVDPLDVVILAVKPQDSGLLFQQLSGRVNELTLVVSIMAGVTLSRLENGLKGPQIVRVMPNTPCAIQQGMSVYCGNKQTTLESLQTTEKILSTVGKVIKVDSEQLIDAATAISGSGPAYLFYLAEALMKGAKRLGFTEEQANILSTQTVLGASMLLDQSMDTAGVLRKKVTSAGGTTEAAIRSFDQNEVKEKLIGGFSSAFDRSVELGKE